MKRIKTKGMTLYELLLSVFLVSVSLGALLSSLLAAVTLINLAKSQTIAIQDLRNMSERIRSTALENIPTSFPDFARAQTGSLDGPTTNRYSTVVGGYTLNSEHISVSYRCCNPVTRATQSCATFSGGISDPVELNLNLSWQEKSGRTYSMSISTYKAR